MIDKSDVEIAAIHAEFGKNAIIKVCFFHTCQAWERWLRKTSNRVSVGMALLVPRWLALNEHAAAMRSAIMTMIRAMVLAQDDLEFTDHEAM